MVNIIKNFSKKNNTKGLLSGQIDNFPAYQLLNEESNIYEVRLFCGIDTVLDPINNLTVFVSFDGEARAEVQRKEDGQIFGGADGNPCISVRFKFTACLTEKGDYVFSDGRDTAPR